MMIEPIHAKQAIIDKIKENTALRTEPTDVAWFRKSSTMSQQSFANYNNNNNNNNNPGSSNQISSPYNVNPLKRDSARAKQIISKKQKLNEEKISVLHNKRNEGMKSIFQLYDKEATLDEHVKSNMTSYQGIMASVQFANIEKENQLKKLQEVLQQQILKQHNDLSQQNFKANSTASGGFPSGGFSSQQLGSSTKSLFGIFQDNPNNAQFLQEHIIDLQSGIESVHFKAENESEKIQEHEYMISNLTQTNKGLREEINDLSEMNRRYEYQVESMNVEILKIKKGTDCMCVMRNDTFKAISQEEQGNNQRIQTYRQAEEIYQNEIKDELKVYNTAEDEKFKYEKKLADQQKTLETLDWALADTLRKQDKQYDLIKQMNTFNLLSNTFIYSNLKETEEDQQFELTIEELEKMNSASDSIKLSSSQEQKAQILMEEIAKFQDLHKDSFNETVESLIILYKDLMCEHQTMGTRVEDLLVQKNKLANEENSLIEGGDKLEIRQKYQVDEQLQREYRHLVLQQHERERTQNAVSHQLQLRDIASMEQLISKCFLFLTQTLFRLGRILMSTKALLVKAQQEEHIYEGVTPLHINNNNGNNNTIDATAGLVDSAELVKSSLLIDEEEKVQSCNILDPNNALFACVDAVLQFAAATNAIVPQQKQLSSQQIPRSTRSISFIASSFADSPQQAQKSELLAKLYHEKLEDIPDVSLEFFEFLKRDFMLNYFCMIPNYSTYFSSMRQTILECLEAYVVQQNKREMFTHRNDVSDETVLNIEKLKHDSELKEVVLEVLFSKLAALRNEGQNNFENVLSLGLKHFEDLVNKSSSLGRNIVEHLKVQVPSFERPISLQEQLIQMEKQYFQKSHEKESKRHSIKTVPSSPTKVDWKETIIAHKIEEMENHKGLDLERANEIRLNLQASNSSRNYQSEKYQSQQTPQQVNQVQFSKVVNKFKEGDSLLHVQQSDEDEQFSPTSHYNPERDQIEDEEIVYMQDQRCDTKNMEAKQLSVLKEEQLREIRKINEHKKGKLFTELKRRDITLSLESKEMWERVKSFDRQRSTLTSRTYLPSISSFDIKNAFLAQRATLKLVNYPTHSYQTNIECILPEDYTPEIGDRVFEKRRKSSLVGNNNNNSNTNGNSSNKNFRTQGQVGISSRDSTASYLSNADKSLYNKSYLLSHQSSLSNLRSTSQFAHQRQSRSPFSIPSTATDTERQQMKQQHSQFENSNHQLRSKSTELQTMSNLETDGFSRKNLNSIYLDRQSDSQRNKKATLLLFPKQKQVFSLKPLSQQISKKRDRNGERNEIEIEENLFDKPLKTRQSLLNMYMPQPILSTSKSVQSYSLTSRNNSNLKSQDHEYKQFLQEQNNIKEQEENSQIKPEDEGEAEEVKNDNDDEDIYHL